MSITFAIAIYIVVWWITLFAVLPFGVHTQHEAGETIQGTPASAPAKFSFGRVALLNTVVATVVFGVIWLMIEYDVFNIAEIANNLPK